MADLKFILLAFVTAIVGVVLLQSVANSQVSATQLNTVTNESVTLTNNTVTSLANNQLDSFTRLGNDSTTLDDPADYTVNLQQGQITFNTGNASVADGTYDASYTYREVGSSTARSLVNLITLFFALGVLLFVVGLTTGTLQDVFNKLR